ncbi:MAG: S9 family peptidase [Candidatus Vogelbacteria bacterium]|nr:S9 family peptidase [Candidatus Vogelbacteria bacterium]
MLSQKQFREGGVIPPLAEKREHITNYHGVKKNDPYYWLRDKSNPDVIKYIEAENEYTSRVSIHTRDNQKKLFDEMLSRIKEDDSSVPIRIDDYFYYDRTEKGKAYLIHCRKKDSLEGVEEIILDENELAQGRRFFHCAILKISPDHKTLAYSVDFQGDQRNILCFKPLDDVSMSCEPISMVSSFEWAKDSTTYFYSVMDEALRSSEILQGSLLGVNRLILKEDDVIFSLSLTKSRSGRYVYLDSSSYDMFEIRIIDLDNILEGPLLVQPRKKGVQYTIYDQENTFYMLTDEDAENGKILWSKSADTSIFDWRPLIEASNSVVLSGLDCFKDFIIVYGREDGIAQMYRLDTHSRKLIKFDLEENVRTIYPVFNPEYKAQKFRIGFSSYAIPTQVREYNPMTREFVILKEQEVPGFEKSNYVSKRIFANAEDGTKIPISLCYRKETFRRDSSNPAFIYGYGSYGIIIEPQFSTNRISLLDRGFVFATAHIRGGGEFGRPWNNAAKFENKVKTFSDFVSAIEHLIGEKYTNSDKIVINGGSAGGLLMGAVANMKHDLVKVVFASVPFVDILNTMMDPTLTSSTLEYEEWGNPDDKKLYDAMNSYSPYENIKHKNYPIMLVTAGFNDPLVNYWEPAKWVAKLRAMKTDDNVIVLKTNMNAGHQGASGLYEGLKEDALEYAFILDSLDLT